MRCLKGSEGVGHQDVVHVVVFDEEFFAEGAFGVVAGSFVEAAGGGVGGEDAEGEFAGAAGLGHVGGPD